MNRFDLRKKIIEISIFGVVCLGFLNSIYNFVSQDSDSEDTMNSTVANSAQYQAVETKISDPATRFVPYTTLCQEQAEKFETTASKIQITGAYCGQPYEQPHKKTRTPATTTPVAAEAPKAIDLAEYKITNLRNHYMATVYLDKPQEKFSTDFIPLEPGSNELELTFTYQNKKVVKNTVFVIRSELQESPATESTH